MEASFVWINDVSKHVLGAPLGGYKQSGVGREEGIEEFISVTREKSVFSALVEAGAISRAGSG